MPTIRQRIVSIIKESPGIHISQLRARLPGLTVTQVDNALHELKVAEKITTAGYGCYRVPEPQRPSAAGIGQTAPLSRLMAGR